jgi:RNA polymerase sigma-70 factor (ECF subfamily)
MVSTPKDALLSACREGDERAWRHFFFENADRVYRWAVLLGLSGPDAADAAQEVLATAVRRIDQCPGSDAVGAWLYQITRRIVANARRKRWLHTLFGAGGEAAPAFEQEDAADAERSLAVRRCLERLPWAQREVLVLMDVEGHTRDEVAAMLRLPQGTVGSRLRLARAAFRKCWEATGGSSTPVALSWGEP